MIIGRDGTHFLLAFTQFSPSREIYSKECHNTVNDLRAYLSTARTGVAHRLPAVGSLYPQQIEESIR